MTAPTLGTVPFAPRISITLPGVLIVAEFIGAFLGGTLVWLMYLPHWGETEDQGLKLAVFSTGPAIRNTSCLAWHASDPMPASRGG